MVDRGAAGPAAGFHFQVQRSLLLLLASEEGSEVSLETADDIVLDSTTGKPQHHQLKHSLVPRTLTDSSPTLWKAFEAWMDTEAKVGSEDVVFRLVATHAAVAGSAGAALRPPETQDRDTAQAERLLMAVAATAPDPVPSGASSLIKSRARFRALPSDRRKALLERVYVHDGDGDIGDLRERLCEQLGAAALPRVGVDLFLDQVMGWWEEVAAAMMMGTRETTGRDEVIDHIRGVRDTFSEGRLPTLDRDLLAGLTDALGQAYHGEPFVAQLRLVALRDERVQVAIEDFHRAYVQRSRWVKHSVLTHGELETWEEQLVDEWRHAFLRMSDELGDGGTDEERVAAGKKFFGDMEATTEPPLRDGSPLIRRGTLHGLANEMHVGWHPDFQTLLAPTIGRIAGAAPFAPSNVHSPQP